MERVVITLSRSDRPDTPSCVVDKLVAPAVINAIVQLFAGTLGVTISVEPA